MGFSVSGILVLFLFVNSTVSREACSDGMIKDAILSLARIIRDNSQKAERHEARERHLGENLKRAMEDLTKKVSIVDTFITHFSKIDDRISEIEELISQRDQRERIQMQKTTDSIQNLETRLEAQLDQIKNAIVQVGQRVEPTEATTTAETISPLDIISKLNDTEVHFLEKVAQLQSSLDTMANESKEVAATQAEKQRIASAERDERETIQNRRTKELIENLENLLKTRMDEIENRIHEVNEHVEPTQPTTTTESVSVSDIIAKLNESDVKFLEKIAQIQTDLDTMAHENIEEAATQAEKLQTVLIEVKNITGRLWDIESSLEEVQQAVKKENEKPKEPVIDIMAIFEVQSRAIRNVTDLVEDTLNRIQDLPMTSEIQAMHNETQSALQETKHTLQSAVGDKIDGIIGSIGENEREIKDSIEDLRLGLANNTQHVNKKLNDLAKGQGVMVSTADEVLDTKKKVEYAVHQILSQVNELITRQGLVINKTLEEKFEGISTDIINNHSNALANLTATMKQELDTVWRQVTVMNQQMIQNAEALDKLNQQNEAYINGTTSTMDGMETKVSDIKQRMSEVDNNLNYLLGRLSLVTEQFNQIKTGLGTALDDIKASFKEVQEKANGLTHPGPHPVPTDYREDEQHVPGDIEIH